MILFFYNILKIYLTFEMLSILTYKKVNFFYVLFKELIGQRQIEFEFDVNV